MTPASPSRSENNLVKLTDPLLKGVFANIYGRNILPLPWRCHGVKLLSRQKYGGVMEACTSGSLWDRNCAYFSHFSASHEGFLYKLLYQTNMELNPQHVMFWKRPISLSQWSKTTAVKGSGAIICSLVIISAPALSHAVVAFSSPKISQTTQRLILGIIIVTMGVMEKSHLGDDLNRFFSF